MTILTPAERLALAVCPWRETTLLCPRICQDCRDRSVAVVRELAQILRERHGGSSQVADWLDGVGCYSNPSTQKNED